MFRVKFIPLYDDNDPPYYVRPLNHSWRRRVGSGLQNHRQLPCDYCALVRVKFRVLREDPEAPFRKWENTKNSGKRSPTPFSPLSPSTRKRKCRPPLRHAFFPRFLTSLPHLKFYRSYWRRPAVPNVFPISVTGFCDMTNAPQINRAHYLPSDAKYFIRGKK